MPVYEYECDVCGVRFEVKRRYGAPGPTTCPKGHEGVHRVFVPPVIIFKGSGFYSTDHGRNGRVPVQKSGDQDTSNSEKPEAKAADKEATKTATTQEKTSKAKEETAK
jgi:putative FmdB family regulatory protein